MPPLPPIQVRHPVAHDLVDDPIHVAGVGTGFEGVITARVRNKDGTVLVEVPVHAGGTGIWGNFAQDLDIAGTPRSYHGSLEMFEFSSSGDGTELNKQSVPITFGSALVSPHKYEGFEQHAVTAGETLIKIAQQHYGAGDKYRIIFEANRDQITDPDRIRVGQVLRIQQWS